MKTHSDDLKWILWKLSISIRQQWPNMIKKKVNLAIMMRYLQIFWVISYNPLTYSAKTEIIFGFNKPRYMKILQVHRRNQLLYFLELQRVIFPFKSSLLLTVISEHIWTDFPSVGASKTHPPPSVLHHRSTKNSSDFQGRETARIRRNQEDEAALGFARGPERL